MTFFRQDRDAYLNVLTYRIYCSAVIIHLCMSGLDNVCLYLPVFTFLGLALRSISDVTCFDSALELDNNAASCVLYPRIVYCCAPDIYF